jgi:dethiobiotin synthetase
MAPSGLFITGTDTGVGKTCVACAIIRILRGRGIRVGAYKPAVTGSQPGLSGPIWDDVARLQAALGRDVAPDRICPQRFHAPLAPPVAARHEGRVVDAALLRRGIVWWNDQAEVMIVEGAGGLLAPVTDTESIADVARDLGFPLIIVARLSLGTINHTLLTLEAARNRKLDVAGIIFNSVAAIDRHDPSTSTNSEEIVRRCEVPILAILPHAAEPDLLQHRPLSTIDWMQLAKSGRRRAARHSGDSKS